MKRILIPLLALSASTAFATSHAQPGAHFIENWDLDGDGRVTLEEAIEKRGDLFYMFDQDENGVLDGAEYDQFDATRRADIDMNAGGRDTGPMKQLDARMGRAFNDADGDGMVTRDEFLAGTSDWFALVDRDGDGAITSADFGPPRGD